MPMDFLQQTALNATGHVASATASNPTLSDFTVQLKATVGTPATATLEIAGSSFNDGMNRIRVCGTSCATGWPLEGIFRAG